MHTAEETASLLASLAPFSLFPTSKDRDARGHFVSQQRWAISPSAGKGRGGNWTNSMRISWLATQNTSWMAKQCWLELLAKLSFYISWKCCLPQCLTGLCFQAEGKHLGLFQESALLLRRITIVYVLHQLLKRFIIQNAVHHFVHCTAIYRE